MKLLKRFLPLSLSLLLFIISILKIPYPNSLTQAGIVQIVGFFIPLFLAIMFTVNIFLKNFWVSASCALGIILLLILKALNSLSILTFAFVAISTGLLISYFRKIKKRNLQKVPKIPKLTRLRKQ